MTAPSASAPAKAPGGLVAAGYVLALAPLWLFAVAAFSGLGPRTATLVFAVPVLLSTVGTILVARRVAAAGSAPQGRVIGLVGLVLGGLGYLLWVYLASVGITFGDGPL